MPIISGCMGTFGIGKGSSGIRDKQSPQDLAFHDSGELLPESAAILAEDIKSGKVVLVTTETAQKAVRVLEESGQ